MYYGQEIFLKGGNDPNNREALWDHGYNGNEIIQKLNKLRQIAISKDSKYLTTLSRYLYHDDYQLFYQKGLILVGLNGQGTDRKIPPYHQTIHGTPYSHGEMLVEILSCRSTIAGAGQVVVTMQNGVPIVLYPKVLLVGSGVCGI